jgi:hypothetical protein
MACQNGTDKSVKAIQFSKTTGNVAHWGCPDDMVATDDTTILKFANAKDYLAKLTDGNDYPKPVRMLMIREAIKNNPTRFNFWQETLSDLEEREFARRVHYNQWLLNDIQELMDGAVRDAPYREAREAIAYEMTELRDILGNYEDRGTLTGITALKTVTERMGYHMDSVAGGYAGYEAADALTVAKFYSDMLYQVYARDNVGLLTWENSPEQEAESVALVKMNLRGYAERFDNTPEGTPIPKHVRQQWDSVLAAKELEGMLRGIKSAAVAYQEVANYASAAMQRANTGNSHDRIAQLNRVAFATRRLAELVGGLDAYDTQIPDVKRFVKEPEQPAKPAAKPRRRK